MSFTYLDMADFLGIGLLPQTQRRLGTTAKGKGQSLPLRARGARARGCVLTPPPADHRRPNHATHRKPGTRSQRREKSLEGTFLSDQGPKAAGFPSLQTKDRRNLQIEFRTRTEPSADVSVETTRSQRGACVQTSARWGGLSSRPIATRQARSAGGFGLRLRDAHARQRRHDTPPPPHSIRAFDIRVFLRTCF